MNNHLRDEGGMDCRTVRDLVDAYITEQVLVETAQAIASHLDRCPRCAAEIAGVRRMRASLCTAFETAQDLTPGPAFRVAMSARLQSELKLNKSNETARNRFRPRPWLAWAAAAVLVISGGFGVRGLGVSGFTAIVEAAVGDHRFCALVFKLLEPPIPLAEAARLDDDSVLEALESAQPATAQIGGTPLSVLERHACVYDGRRFGHVVLGYKRTAVSVVVTRDERWLRNFPGGTLPGDGAIVTLPATNGFHVAGFRGPRHLVFAISTLSDEDVRAVASAMSAPILHAVMGAK